MALFEIGEALVELATEGEILAGEAEPLLGEGVSEIASGNVAFVEEGSSGLYAGMEEMSAGIEQMEQGFINQANDALASVNNYIGNMEQKFAGALGEVAESAGLGEELNLVRGIQKPIKYITGAASAAGNIFHWIHGGDTKTEELHNNHGFSSKEEAISYMHAQMQKKRGFTSVEMEKPVRADETPDMWIPIEDLIDSDPNIGGSSSVGVPSDGNEKHVPGLTGGPNLPPVYGRPKKVIKHPQQRLGPAQRHGDLTLGALHPAKMRGCGENNHSHHLPMGHCVNNTKQSAKVGDRFAPDGSVLTRVPISMGSQMSHMDLLDHAHGTLAQGSTGQFGTNPLHRDDHTQRGLL